MDVEEDVMLIVLDVLEFVFLWNLCKESVPFAVGVFVVFIFSAHNFSTLFFRVDFYRKVYNLIIGFD